MFQFRRFPSYAYFIQRRMTEYCSAGFPHSDISGSMRMCRSPKLFAAYRVLHRLLMPRHSPCALFSLTFVAVDSVSFASAQAPKLTHFVTAPLEIKTFVLISQLAWSLISCSQNYAGSTKKNFAKLRYPKKFHILLFQTTLGITTKHRPLLPCFLLSHC